MENRYTLNFAYLKVYGFRYSKNQQKFLFKMSFSNYPVPYRNTIYKYCLSSRLFKSLKLYYNARKLFKKNNFKKDDLVAVVTDRKNDCPRAIGIIKPKNNLGNYGFGTINNSSFGSSIYYNSRWLTLDKSNREMLANFNWIDFYNDFSVTKFEDMEL